MVSQINNIITEKKYGFLKLAIGFSISAAILKETDPYVSIVLMLFAGYFILRSD